LLVAAAAVLIASCAKKDDAISQAEKKDGTKGVAAPSIADTKAIVEEGFIFGLPVVMNYAVAVWGVTIAVSL
jgi:cellobiose-specific phosphotransferase system component IIC